MQLLIFSFLLYRVGLVIMVYGVTILTSTLAGWWAQMDSDHRPHAYQACALTS